MALVISLIIAFVLLFVTIFFIKNHLKVKEMIKEFKRSNVIVFGKKGTGKDLVFNYVINKRKETYYSNVDYGGDYKYIETKDLTTGNTYVDFINNDINVIEKDFSRETKDIYLSDCGIILPSQYDSSLHKIFPSFSSYYALSRHLYNSNVHCNTQALSRVWKALREQADYYVNTRYTIKLFGLLITKVYTYDNYASAEKNIRPYKLKKGLNDRTAQELYQEFESVNGVIKSMYIFQKVKGIHYDTRAYHTYIFGFPFINPKKAKKSVRDALLCLFAKLSRKPKNKN